MAGVLQPLDQKFAIVDARGNPTDYFVRWAQQRQIDIGDAITLPVLQQYLTDHALLVEGSGIQFTPPGGDLNNGPITIAADVQEILDQITATRGAILYRGLLGWTSLLPGAAGLFLQTAGAGADPLWAAAGGGGGSTPLLPFPSDIGAAPNIASGAFGCPALAVLPAFAKNNESINALYLSVVGLPAGLKATPVIYGGIDPLVTQPTPNGAALLASGPDVTLAANTTFRCLLSAPFAPTNGLFYYIGFALHGASGNASFGVTGSNRRQWFVSGTFSPPPANLPAMSAGAGTNVGWWSD